MAVQDSVERSCRRLLEMIEAGIPTNILLNEAKTLTARALDAVAESVSRDVQREVELYRQMAAKVERQKNENSQLAEEEPKPVCRKCHACKNRSHHWVPNPDPGLRRAYTCMHCPAKGVECTVCGGKGCFACDGGVKIAETKEEP